MERKQVCTGWVEMCLVWAITGSAAWGQDFLPRHSVEIRGSAIGVTHGDFDGDGLMDLGIGNNQLSIATALFGTSAGELGSPFEIPNPGNLVLALAAGDFDEDGRDDLAFNNVDAVAVVFGSFGGTLTGFLTFSATSAAADIDAFDLDMDGHLDLIYADRGSTNTFLLYGNGDGTFAPTMHFVSPGSRNHAVEAADFNMDGLIDVAVTTNDDTGFTVHYGTSPRGQFDAIDYAVSEGDPEGLVAGDFNNDGKTDLAYTLSTDQIGIALGDGVGGFGQRLTYAASRTVIDIDSGDFNNDGFLDLATVTQNLDDVGVFIGVGDGTFIRRDDLTASANGTATIDIADLNGDGFDDIIVASASGNAVDIFFAVPEPTSILMLCIASVGLLRRRGDAGVSCGHRAPLPRLSLQQAVS